MVEYVKALFGLFGNDEETEGQGLVEYALILVLISVVAIGIMTTVGGQVSQVFSSVSAAL
jgi:pilus assembly protein Flp/PilA